MIEKLGLPQRRLTPVFDLNMPFRWVPLSSFKFPDTKSGLLPLEVSLVPGY